MLIHCPKCGFQQPQDQYCARCGVDMLNYKPNSIESSRKAVSRSGLIQIIFFVILVASISFFIGKSDHEQKWVTKMRGLPSAIKTTTTSSTTQLESPTAPNNDSNPDFENAEKSPEIEIAVESPDQLNRLTGDTISTASENKLDDSSPNSKAKTESLSLTTLNPDISVSFIEVSKPILTQWIQQAQSKNSFQNFPEFSAGILHISLQNLENQIKKLKKEGSQVQAGKIFSFLSGKSFDDGSDFIGFQTQIEIKSLENQLIKGQFSLVKNTRQNKEQFVAELELQKGTTFFLIPKNSMNGFENEPSLLQIRPFQILQSTDFQNTKSEFVILIGNE